MSARETGDLPRCALCGSLNGIIDRQVMLLSITRGPGHRELWSVMACERCAVAVVEKNTGDGAQVHAPLAASTPTTAPPPASPEPAREWTEEQRDMAVRLADTFTHKPVGRGMENLCAAIARVAPHFAPKVRVKLPERLPIEPGMRPETFERRTTYNQAIDACAAAIRAAGAEIEGEAP